MRGLRQNRREAGATPFGFAADRHRADDRAGGSAVEPSCSSPASSALVSAEISSWVRGRRAVAEHKHRVVFLTVALLSLSSCGVADRVSYENGAEQLRVEVHRIVDASAKDVSTAGNPTVEAVQRQLRGTCPLLLAGRCCS